MGFSICSGCEKEIDEEVCHCGNLIEFHNVFNDGHSGVPMGCVCGFIKDSDEDEEKTGRKII